ncbi:PDZ domain-containing protein [Amycolatopsis panacis]|uniref:PDZ domain-containing protein n=1 Tax=Amycolatopsis panacis TaxID=2340917 RepID=A0A419HXN2_9PSEU|nr:trypsin-like peptidase domain-containing protein [Amycolatopsis panacis]RJQ81909.1 PDZ domain-containing protein [Amycolatopsis panacis]
MTENDPDAPDSATGRQDPGAQPGAPGQAAWNQQQPASGEPVSQPPAGQPGPAYGTTGGAPSPWSAQGAAAAHGNPASGGQGTPDATTGSPAGSAYGGTASGGSVSGSSAETSPTGSASGAASSGSASSASSGGAAYGASAGESTAPGNPAHPTSAGAGAVQGGSEYGTPAGGTAASSPYGVPVGSAYPGGPGQSYGQHQSYPPGGPQTNPYGTPDTSAYGVSSQPAKKPGPGKLLAGVAAIALVIGGVAGGTVGYLTGGSSGPSVNALDQPKPAQQTGNAPTGSIESVAQKLSPSVVELKVSGRTSSGEGSGFVLSSDGYILTNNHVVQAGANGGQIQAAFPDGRKATASVVGRDPTTDIAVVKVSGVANLTPVQLGRSDDLRVGQPVVAIGSPFALAGTVTSGIVSSLHRPVKAGGEQQGDQNTVMDAIQTDAAINPGNSGGPLANASGQVIGINSAIYSPNSGQGSGGQGGNVGIGFAIPIDQARRTADDIIKTGHANQTFIGAKVADAPQGGAQLGDITPGSPADKAGLKSGDVVTKIDDRVIDSADTLVAAIRTRAPDEKATFTLAGGRTVEVTLGGQPVPVN